MLARRVQRGLRAALLPSRRVPVERLVRKHHDRARRRRPARTGTGRLRRLVGVQCDDRRGKMAAAKHQDRPEAQLGERRQRGRRRLTVLVAAGRVRSERVVARGGRVLILLVRRAALQVGSRDVRQEALAVEHSHLHAAGHRLRAVQPLARPAMLARHTGDGLRLHPDKRLLQRRGAVRRVRQQVAVHPELCFGEVHPVGRAVTARIWTCFKPHERRAQSAQCRVQRALARRARRARAALAEVQPPHKGFERIVRTPRSAVRGVLALALALV